MSLGKRPRPPMRRTTSMTEFAADATQPSDQEKADRHQRERQRAAAAAAGGERSRGVEWQDSRCAAAVPSPRGWERRHSADLTVVDTAAFLRACGLCKRRLSGRDIFMYRGEIAFCSLECRQQRMNLDERKEKRSLASMAKDAPPPPTAAASDASGGGETVAAA